MSGDGIPEEEGTNLKHVSLDSVVGSLQQRECVLCQMLQVGQMLSRETTLTDNLGPDALRSLKLTTSILNST